MEWLATASTLWRPKFSRPFETQLRSQAAALLNRKTKCRIKLPHRYVPTEEARVLHFDERLQYDHSITRDNVYLPTCETCLQDELLAMLVMLGEVSAMIRVSA